MRRGIRTPPQKSLATGLGWEGMGGKGREGGEGGEEGRGRDGKGGHPQYFIAPPVSSFSFLEICLTEADSLRIFNKHGTSRYLRYGLFLSVL